MENVKTIDCFVVGKVYTLKSGDKMKIIRYIPPKENDRYDCAHYEIECNGKKFIHSEYLMKHLLIRED